MEVFNENIIQQIEQYASWLFTIPEIAIITGIREGVLRSALADHESDAYRAYMRGKYKTLVEIRSQEIELARAGSPVALANAGTMLRDMNAAEL